MKTLAIGLVLAVAPWIVFRVVDAMNPQAMLVGLGILTFLVRREVFANHDAIGQAAPLAG